MEKVQENKIEVAVMAKISVKDGCINVEFNRAIENDLIGKMWRYDINGNPLAAADIIEAFYALVDDQIHLTEKMDPSLAAILRTMYEERDKKIGYYRQTWRFIKDQKALPQDLRFLLTTDTNDFPHHIQMERERERKQQAEIEQDKILRAEHADLIKKVALKAINECHVSCDEAKKFFQLGLIKVSTSFRSNELFPGECYTLFYEFTEGLVKSCGYIGFDAKFELLSVDQRFPRSAPVYLRESVA